MQSGWWKQPSILLVILKFIVNGFIRAGICRALDGQSSDDKLDELLCELDSSEVSTTSDDHDDEVEPNKESCSSYSTYDQQARDPNAVSGGPVIVVYSSTSDEDV